MILTMLSKIKNNLLLLILLGAFVLGLFYSFHFAIRPVVDARAYDTIAANLAAGRGYRENLSVSIQDDHGVVRVGPLYEYFLAAIYKIFGHHYGAVWVIQNILHVLSALLLYLICLRIFPDNGKGKKIGLIAAAIFAFYPDLIENSAMLMTETVYLFLFCLALYLFFRFFNLFNTGKTALLGLVFGLAVMARPPVLFLAPVVIYYFWKKNQSRRLAIRQIAIFSIIMAAVFIPWTVRNYSVYNRFWPFGPGGAYNFWIGNYHGGDGEQGAEPEILKFFDTHSNTEVYDESMKQFKGFLIAYPLEFLKITILRINKYWSVIRPMGFWYYFAGAAKILFIFSSAAASVFLFIFGLAGAIKASKEKNEKLYYLLVFAAITPLILFVTVVETRYRFQIYPFLAIFCGYLLANGGKWRKGRAFFYAALIIFINGAIDFILNAERVLERLKEL